MLHKEITERVLRAFFDVYNHLGDGFLEKVYQNALMIEVGLLLNFGPKPTFKRVVFSNRRCEPSKSTALTNPST